ncbi:retromer complex subunit Vps35 [Sorochytrium milnesiophthora]
MSQADLAPPEDQAKLLEDAVGNVKAQAYHMRRCLDSDRLMDALKHASAMLAELRTSSLTPKNYYELYMVIFDSLRLLSSTILDLHTSNKHDLADLYEVVQYAGNVVPRLYLMITVGSAYMSTKEIPVKVVMRDLIEMCRGVQHPIRGLFLRHYLTSVTKDFLPDGLGDELRASSSSPNGNVHDSISFILQNFTEMNKLWVRMQYQGLTKEKDRRESERRELRILVGTNLVRIGQLDAVDLDMYKSTILPSILEQIVICKDVIAQEYLMEVITQVFPDSYHLGTLREFLSATAQLSKVVNIKQIIVALIDRLSAYALRSSDDAAEEQPQPAVEDGEHAAASVSPTTERRGIPGEIQLFEIFWSQVTNTINARPDLSMPDVTSLFVSLMNLSLSCYPERLEYVDQVLRYCKEHLQKAPGNIQQQAPATTQNIQAILAAPVNAYNNILTLLTLPKSAESYRELLALQPYSLRHSVSLTILGNLLKHKTPLTTADDVTGVFQLIGVLIKDQKDGPTWKNLAHPTRKTGLFGTPVYDVADEMDAVKRREQEAEISEELGLVAKLLHQLHHDDIEKHYGLIFAARAQLMEGGGRRMKYTYPALVHEGVCLAHRVRASKDRMTDDEYVKKCMSIFKFVHQLGTTLNAKSECYELCLRLFLQAGQSADECGFEEIAYEFYVQAFSVYEESIPVSRAQFAAITLITGALQSSRVFGVDNYDTLATKCTQHAAKLLKRPDQCRAVTQCSHLFWQTESQGRSGDASNLTRDGKRVLECLQKALKIADACLDSVVNVELFVEILNRCLYFYERGNTAITAEYLNGLIDLISTNLADQQNSTGDFNISTAYTGSSSSLFGTLNADKSSSAYLEEVIRHFRTTMHIIEQRKSNPPPRDNASVNGVAESSADYTSIDTKERASVLEISFDSREQADIAAQVLSVDKELKHTIIQRTISVVPDATLHIAFTSTDLKMLRTSANSILEHLQLVISTMAELHPQALSSLS